MRDSSRISFGRHFGQFSRAFAAASRDRQRQQERAVRDQDRAIASLNARVDKIDAEWDRVLARFDNYEAARELRDPAALQRAFDYINERIRGLASRSIEHAEDVGALDPELSEAFGAQIAEKLNEWETIHAGHVALMAELRTARSS